MIFDWFDQQVFLSLPAFSLQACCLWRDQHQVLQDQHVVELRSEDVVVWVGVVCAKEEVTESAPWQKRQGC
jgi:hypothetical protein